MAAILIDGKAVAAKARAEAAERTAALKKKGVVPCLAVVLVGNDPASLSYVTGKEKALAGAGMEGRDIRLPETTSEAELLKLIEDLNEDPAVHGILVQLPLPKQIREDKVITAINPAKDVDGFHPVSVGNLVLGKPGFLPCTPHGILVLLKEAGIPTKGAHAVIVGRSNLVGKPLANLLSRRDINCTVTLCHTGTRDLPAVTRQADILVAAVGKAGLITADMVKPGAAVIDVGVNRVADPAAKKGYRLKGDVDFEAVKDVAGWLTPVPGGVGPMTIAMLLLNVAQAAEQPPVAKKTKAGRRKTAAQSAREKILALGIPVTQAALCHCAADGNKDLVALFLKAGFPVNSTDSKGVGLLHLAARNSRDAMVGFLIKNKADINMVSHDRGSSALIDAAMAKDTALVKLLLDAGADPNIKTRDGQSALILSVGLNDEATSELLLKAGAQADEPDSLGASARKYATLFGKPGMTALFEKYASGAK